MNAIQAVAADLERSNRDIAGTRIKGTSQTAKNVHGALDHIVGGGHASHTALTVGLIEGLQQAFEHGGVHGLALASAPLGAAYALNKMRSSGLSKEQAMFRDALLNPDRARAYVQKVQPHNAAAPYRVLASSLRRELIATPIVAGAAAQ